MALNKELEILVSDSFGGEEWLSVLRIDLEEENVDVQDNYGDTITLDLNADNIHEIRISEETKVTEKFILKHLPQIHDLKIQKNFYKDVITGRKTFEIRKNDRDFQVGDLLNLQEIDEDNQAQLFTGEEVKMKITYITDFAQQNGYVVLGIEPWLDVKKEGDNARSDVNINKKLKPSDVYYGMPQCYMIKPNDDWSDNDTEDYTSIHELEALEKWCKMKVLELLTQKDQ